MNASLLSSLPRSLRPQHPIPTQAGFFLAMYGNLYIDTRNEVLVSHYATKVIPLV